MPKITNKTTNQPTTKKTTMAQRNFVKRIHDNYEDMYIDKQMAESICGAAMRANMMDDETTGEYRRVSRRLLLASLVLVRAAAKHSGSASVNTDSLTTMKQFDAVAKGLTDAGVDDICYEMDRECDYEVKYDGSVYEKGECDTSDEDE
jgi:ABC-type phosphonate transport system ATPase subunit